MTYQSYAPESASQRPNVVVLPPELFARKSLMDMSVADTVVSLDRQFPPRSPDTIATVTDLATREVIAPTPAEQEVQELSVETIPVANVDAADRIAAARAQIEQLHDTATRFTLTGAPEALDPAYLTNLNQAA